MIDYDVLFETNRGCYQSFSLDLVDETTGSPLVLTGYTLEATYRERGSSPLLLTTAAGAKLAIDPFVPGRINLVINEADTLLLPSRDRTACYNCDQLYTCFCQITGTVLGSKYLLATIAINNISTTGSGGT